MRYFEIIQEGSLFEAQNYETMMNPVSKKLSLVKDYVVKAQFNDEMIKFIENAEKSLQNFPKIVSSAKKNLKRNDAIVWYLKICRKKFLNDFVRGLRYISMSSSKSDDDATKQLLKQLLNFIKQTFPEIDAQKVNGIPWTPTRAELTHDQISGQLSHFLSLPISKIQNFRFKDETPEQVFRQFHKWEDEWKETRNRLVPYYPDFDKPVMQFTDGYEWVKLDREFCRTEGNAMGHCGNEGSPKGGDTILSLRKIVKVGSEKYWEPALTFILHKNGMLGEMKGRGNDKPASKYHKYIIALLDSPMIKGIEGGGYLPENNFDLSDLPLEDQERLLDKKKTLVGDLRKLPDKYWTPQFQYDLVKKKPSDIRFIIKKKIWPKNEAQWQKIQIEAVKNDVGAFSILERNDIPISDAVKRAHEIAKISEDEWSFFKKYMKSEELPPEDMMIAGVKFKTNLYFLLEKFGDKVPEKVLIAGVSHAPRDYANSFDNKCAIHFILEAGIKPSYELELAACKHDGRSIFELLRHPKLLPKDDERLNQLFEAAVKNNGNVIKYIIDSGYTPSEKLQLLCFRTGDSYSLKILKNAGISPSSKVIRAARAAKEREDRYQSEYERLHDI